MLGRWMTVGACAIGSAVAAVAACSSNGAGPSGGESDSGASDAPLAQDV
jgi:hypothetical protein